MSFFNKNCLAPGEARTHGLQIMRLTRCRLRYRGIQIQSGSVLFKSSLIGGVNYLKTTWGLFTMGCCGVVVITSA